MRRAVVTSLAILIATLAPPGGFVGPPGPSVSAQPAVAPPLLERLTIVAPAAPGGGWDQTARAMQHVLASERIVRLVQVENVAGAAGTIGLSQFTTGYRGRGDALIVSGLVMLGAILWNESPVSLEQVTPVARLTGEHEVVAVPASGPHRDMRGIVDLLRTNPAAVSWGGGSAGGTDHILAGLIVAAAGVDPRRANYIAFSGGGEAVASLLGGNLTAGISGYSEFAPHIASGRLRAVAIAATDRVAGLDAPTLREQGLDVNLVNWRAVMGPPGLSTDQRTRLIEVVTRMVRSTTWQQSLADLQWTDMFLSGDSFAAFLATERARMARIITPLRSVSAGNYRATLGEWVFPSLVGIAGIVVTLWLLYDARRRGDAGRPSALALPAPAGRPRGFHANRRALALTAGGAAVFLLMLNRAGFVLASTLLAVSVSAGFGSRRLIRTAAVALLFSVLLYVAFTRGLGLALPAGPLKIH